MTTREQRSPVVLVTGASRGIGLATARLFAAQGYRVYTLSRSAGSDAALSHLTADVSDPAQVRSAMDEILAREGCIDILVNNAGFGISGAVEFTGLEDAKRQLDVNFFGGFLCAQAVLPYMRRQGFGRIINVSSVAGAIAIPFQSFYSAAKAAQNAFTLALANEVRGLNIHVSALMPGDVKTSFTSAREKSPSGGDVYPHMASAIATMEQDEQSGLAPEFIAKCILRIARKRHPKPLYASGLRYSALVLLSRWLPARLVNFLVWRIYQ